MKTFMSFSTPIHHRKCGGRGASGWVTPRGELFLLKREEEGGRGEDLHEGVGKEGPRLGYKVNK